MQKTLRECQNSIKRQVHKNNTIPSILESLICSRFWNFNLSRFSRFLTFHDFRHFIFFKTVLNGSTLVVRLEKTPQGALLLINTEQTFGNFLAAGMYFLGNLYTISDIKFILFYGSITNQLISIIQNRVVS